MEYHNNLASLVKNIQKSHEAIITAVCEELECPEKAVELIAKLLDTSFTSVKAKKDPNRVKKPKSAYMFFCAEHREEIMTNNKGMKMGDIAKLLGSMWRDVSDSDRAKFQKMNEIDIERYEEER